MKKVAKFPYMTDNSTKLATALERIAAEIQALVRTLKPSQDPDLPLEIAQKVDEKLKSGECLCCKRKAVSGRRGLCQPHYAQMRKLVFRGTLSEEDLVAQGLVLPSGKGGRPPADTKLLDQARERESILELMRKGDAIIAGAKAKAAASGQGSGQKRPKKEQNVKK